MNELKRGKSGQCEGKAKQRPPYTEFINGGRAERPGFVYMEARLGRPHEIWSENRVGKNYYGLYALYQTIKKPKGYCEILCDIARTEGKGSFLLWTE